MNRFRQAWIIVTVVPAILSSGSDPASCAPPSGVDFSRDIQPILSEKCFPCHGPDRRKRKAGLRFDTRAGAFVDLGGYRAIVPGKAAESELYLRITAEDREDRMPPPRSGAELTPGEIELIRRWIDEGAPWTSHWSFVPLADVPIPSVKGKSWPLNPIDRFVLARLEEEGLAPAPPASKERLLRRVTFCLAGLPPTLEEIDAFLSDDSPGAYEKVVDRLLASPRYGENVAVGWLDLARFADTYGYQADRDSHLWPWRDWVVRSFNRDLPYDESVTWQVAGDLLPGASREQILATAFNRNHRQTNEGGSVNEEFRVEYNADRVRTTAMAFLGLTMQCARCHEHKFDPISHKEYYQFFAFFNSTDESGLYSHFTDATPCPTLLLYPSDEKEREHEDLKAEIAAKEAKLEAYRQEALERAVRRGAALLGARPVAEIAGLVGDYSFDEIAGGKVRNAVGEEFPGTLRDSPRSVDGKRGKALLFDGENSVSLGGVADFERTDPFSIALWLRIPEGTEEKEKTIVLHHSRAGSDAGSRGYELLLEHGRASFALIHFWPGNSIKVRTTDKLRQGDWTHVAVTYDGSSRARGITISVDGRPAAVEIVRDRLWKSMRYRDRVPLTLAARFRGPGFRGGEIDELKVFNRCLTALEVSAVHDGRPVREVRRADDAASGGGSASGSIGRSGREDLADVVAYRLANFDEDYHRRLDELTELRRRENELVSGIPEIMVMGDLPTPRPTYVLRRGAYDAPGEAVEPGTPSSILEFDASLPKNRLGLARWLVDPRNPLTARVAVNRHWQRLFGRGIVSTPEDFGVQGALPSHPHLLDWLAGWFVEQGWSQKALDRLIVTSATFRQSSVGTPESLEKDPQNTRLSRGPSRRLSAEAIRDGALSAAGLMDFRLGGPSARPGEPIPGAGKDEQPRYRRSLYTYIKRTAPSPYLLTFDGTNRETCIARRQTTNTPLQALVLLNDPVFTDASRRLGERIMREGGASVEAQVAFAFRALTGRRPLSEEREILVVLYREQLTLFESEPERAEELLRGGRYRPDGSLDPPRLAAASILASAILNFDETLTLR